MQTASSTLSLTILPATLTITTASLPNGTQGVAYSQTLAATGGTGAYTWQLTSGTLPNGITLNASSGLDQRHTDRCRKRHSAYLQGDRFGFARANRQRQSYVDHRAADPYHHHHVASQRYGQFAVLADPGRHRRHRLI